MQMLKLVFLQAISGQIDVSYPFLELPLTFPLALIRFAGHLELFLASDASRHFL